ncbi:hypothetical protein [Ferrimicrobium sp.]|uniref:hypothetical protein n=1 Tax=Ferrimicrobium sp. TaxID=2926050 RepID=UPI00262F24C7|nr:hypothetical protein [Ferrimicrobium sp.]
MSSDSVSIWGYETPNVRVARMKQVMVRLLVAFLVTGGIAVVVLTLALGLTGVIPVTVAVVIGVIIGIVITAVATVIGPPRLGRRLPWVEPEPSDRRRIDTLLSGLGFQLGIPESRVAVVAYSMVNGAVLELGHKEPVVVITTGALRELETIELEALLARQLGELRLGLVGLNSVVAYWDQVFHRAGRQLSDWQRAEAVLLDRLGVSVTRYPPAMAVVLEKALASRSISSTTLPAWLWLCPVGVEDLEPDVALREQLLLDEVWTIGAS